MLVNCCGTWWLMTNMVSVYAVTAKGQFISFFGGFHDADSLPARFVCVYGVFFPEKEPPLLSSHRLGILFHHPQTKFTKVMVSQVSVCPRGLSTPLHARIHPPDQRQTPPPPGTRGRHPPRSRHPPPKCMLGDTGNKRVVRILLECILVICPSVYVFCQEQKYVITTRKRSLGQGNVFTPVCDSFCSRGGGVKGIPPLGRSQAGGTHPTGMHSCINVILQKTLNITSIPMMAAGAAHTPSSRDQVRYSNFQN